MDLREEHILHCQMREWLPSLRRVTFPSRILPLPECFVAYLHEDGIQLPKGTITGGALRKGRVWQGNEDDEEEDTAVWNDEDDEDDEDDGAPSFPELEAAIQSAINELGGSAFIKLNWSAPRDASWIMPGASLQCRCPGDVFLLLKSSDFIVHDLDHAFDYCVNATRTRPPTFTLVLRAWRSLSPSGEFRCFVRQRTLIAISQRDPTQFYEYLPDARSWLRPLIESFFHEHIVGHFPDDAFVFDVYVESTQRCWLVDVNPFNTVTEPGLFTWEELESGTGGRDLVFRVVECRGGVRTTLAAVNRHPREAVELTSGEAIERWIAAEKQKDNK